MIEPLLCGIVLGLVPITILGLFVSAWNQYRRGSAMSVAEQLEHQGLCSDEESQIFDSIDKWLERDVRPVVKKYDHSDEYPHDIVGQMKEMGMVMLFAGVQKDDPTKLHAILKFPNVETLQAFGANEELTEERRQAGAVIESAVMTIISEEEYLTNFPEPFVNN